MNRIFITGATGFIGIQLVNRILEAGDKIHALYRSENKADLIRQEGVTLFKGDILDIDGMVQAMKGCNQVYHVAAYAAVWSKDPTLFLSYNVSGTLNVIEAARQVGIDRIVVTSTAGILGPSEKEPVTESSPDPSSFFTLYEDSKYQMEQEIKELGISTPELVVVNPTRVYGPGYLSKSNGMSLMIQKYIAGNWRFIPGDGKRMGNYVYVEDVVTGHLLAMEKGVHGQRYLLGGEDISYNQLFDYVRTFSGVSRRLFHIPIQLLFAVAGLLSLLSKLTGKAPLIVPSWVRKLTHNWLVSSQKATDELGYAPLGAREGIEKTVKWLLKNN